MRLPAGFAGSSGGEGDAIGYRAGAGIGLFIAADRRGAALDALILCLLERQFGRRGLWAVARSPRGAPRACDRAGRARAAISVAHAAGRVVIAISGRRRLGVDAETAERIAAHASPADRWLSVAERFACIEAANRTAALACRWVLKESLGKALGIGLPRQPDRWSFAVADRIEAMGVPAAFDFDLFAVEDLLIGIASAPLVADAAASRPCVMVNRGQKGFCPVAG